MKRFFALAIIFSLGTAEVIAQPNEVTNAWSALNTYRKSKDPYDLNKAKVAIDKATINADTKDNAKTWGYRGNIYLALYQKQLSDTIAAHPEITEPPKKTAKAFFASPVANLVEATNSYLKCKTLDAKLQVYQDDCYGPGLRDCYNDVQNAGITRFNHQMYAESEPMFELAIDISSSSKMFDTVNVHNAADAALNSKMYEQALKNFKLLAAANSGGGDTWAKIASVYKEMGDTVNYKQTISDGLKKYPGNGTLLVEDVNMKMKAGKDQEAIDELSALIAQRPNDAQLNLVVGNVYDRLANPKNADGTDAPKPKNYEELVDKAATYYKKAIDIDPKSLEANYNLGVLYYNQSVEYYNRSASTIADAAKYRGMWEKPLPDAAKYLETAHTLDPKDMSCLIALKNCYSQMSDDANYTRIKEEIKKLQANGG
ncbi:MAG: tetratricopeptide repeat protein [Bacteroidetes bacterium]|nr:tetratricopeptide repeat protein [Bacteroidota bacterium]